MFLYLKNEREGNAFVLETWTTVTKEKGDSGAQAIILTNLCI